MRLGKIVLVGLALLAIASVVRAQFRQPDAVSDSAEGLSARAVVPAPVMSTLRRACFDCHSNETHWPWYAKLPVASWLLEQDVKAARGQLNFSRWAQYNPFDRAGLLDKVCELATAGKMPLPRYLMLHHEARLSQTDIDRLCAWSQQEGDATRAGRIVIGRHQTRMAWVAAVGLSWLVVVANVAGVAGQVRDAFDGWHIPEGAATEPSPVPANMAVIARGKSLYQSKCQRCHGPDGAGHGPEADPDHPPADLTDARRASRNPDGVMFYKIWNGRAKPRMPAMKSEVSAAEAWAIVLYAKTLRK